MQNHIPKIEMNQIEDAISNCKEAYDNAIKKRDHLEGLLTSILSKIIYHGLVVDLSKRKELLKCFAIVNTVRGNDRGTRIFRIESAPILSISMSHFSSSTWSCEATPISESTGKDMDGSVHGANAKLNTVRITGEIFIDDFRSEDMDSVFREQLSELVFNYQNALMD